MENKVEVENLEMILNVQLSQELLTILHNLLSSDNTIRNNAELIIKNKKLTDYPLLLYELLIAAFQRPDILLCLKQMSQILIKNLIIQTPSDWFLVPLIERIKIKSYLQNLIKTTSDINEIKRISLIISSIAYVDSLHNDTSLLKYLISSITIPHQNVRQESFYLYSLTLFFEQYSKVQSIDFSLIEPIISQIIKNISLSQSNDILVTSIELEILILPFLKTYINDNKEKMIYSFLNLLNSNHNIQVIMKELLFLYELLSYYHVEIANYIEPIIQSLAGLIIQSNIKEIVLYSINILCLIADNESITQTRITDYLILNSKDIVDALLQTIDSNATIALDDNDDWSISRSVCYFLAYIVKIQQTSVLIDFLITYVAKFFNAASNHKRFNSLLILSCCLETNHKDSLSWILTNEIKNLWTKISDSEEVISITLSWVLGKISEMFPQSFERESFYELIPMLINTISNVKINTMTRMNTTITLSNIIKYHGDEKTTHHNNTFSYYNKLFVDKFIDLSCTPNSMSIGLSFYLINIVMNVVKYSSLEYQDKLEILLSKVLSHFENINNILLSQDHKTQTVLYIELQNNLCLIIYQLFNKIIRVIDQDLCQRSYNVIIESFKLREPYESGLLCLFNIVIKIEGCIDSFFTYLYLCFTNKENDYLLQEAILTISNLSWNKNHSLMSSSKKVLSLLFNILSDNNVLITIKPLAISAIGDMCLNFSSIIIEDINSIIPLLFSSFDVLMSITDEDCLIILKNVIECFTMILFSLQESHEERIIFKYIKQLIDYINFFASRDQIIIKNNLMLLLSDLINLFGERIREFTTKEEINTIQTKLLVNDGDEDIMKWMKVTIEKIFY